MLELNPNQPTEVMARQPTTEHGYNGRHQEVERNNRPFEWNLERRIGYFTAFFTRRHVLFAKNAKFSRAHSVQHRWKLKAMPHYLRLRDDQFVGNPSLRVNRFVRNPSVNNKYPIPQTISFFRQGRGRRRTWPSCTWCGSQWSRIAEEKQTVVSRQKLPNLLSRGHGIGFRHTHAKHKTWMRTSASPIVRIIRSWRILHGIKSVKSWQENSTSMQ